MLAKRESKTARNRLDEDPDIYMGVRMPVAGVRYYALLDESDRTCPWGSSGNRVHDEGLELSPSPRRQSGGLGEEQIEEGDPVAA